MTSPTPTTLSDLGERRIVRELLAPRYGGASLRFGDDCATLEPAPPGSTLVASTDPCPPPMAHILGYSDEYYRGWLLATINFSDLAAAGACPAGLLTSLILPATTPVTDFERLLDGIDDCCASLGTTTVGGNIKEGPAIDVSATALGYVEDGEPLSRGGAHPGDLIVALGNLGAFWAGVLTVRSGHRLEPSDLLLANVLTPLPKVAVARELHRAGILRCAIDNSDGLQPSLAQLAEASGVGLLLDLSSWMFAQEVQAAAAALGTEPARLALGWGDWQIIGCCSPNRRSELAGIARTHQTAVHILGTVTAGAGISGRFAGAEGPLMHLESERFTTGSWFSAGLDGYIEQLLYAPLLER